MKSFSCFYFNSFLYLAISSLPETVDLEFNQHVSGATLLIPAGQQTASCFLTCVCFCASVSGQSSLHLSSLLYVLSYWASYWGWMKERKSIFLSCQILCVFELLSLVCIYVFNDNKSPQLFVICSQNSVQVH